MKDGAKTDDVESEIRHVVIVVAISVALGLPGLLILGNLDWAQDLSLAYPVGLLGTAGATSNNVRRLHRVRGENDGTLAHLDRRLVIAQIYFSPIIGAVFAALTYALFLSGILQGQFFPKFACSGDNFVSYSDFASCNPSTNADVAMAMVWGFVAGFAERFVPNMIENIIPDDPTTK